VSLSRNDIDKIRQLIRRVDKLESQTAGAEFNTHRGSDHFLVVAPEDGIPAFADPVPGQALCNMVRRFSNDPPEDKELAEMGTKQLVYNLGAAVPEGKVVIAHRDAFGDLFLQPQDVGTLFPLLFSQTGGEDVCPADWTYTVSHAITGDELGTVVDPTAAPHMHQRPDLSLIPATAGLGYYDADGVFTILSCNEVQKTDCDCDCLPPPPCTDCEDEGCCIKLKVTLSGHDLAGENRDHFGGVDGTDEPMVTFGFGDANTLVWSSACGTHGPDGETGWLVEFSVCGATNEDTGNTGTWEAFIPLVTVDGVCCVELGVVDAPCILASVDPPFIDCQDMDIVVEVVACD
jgi:hypothetical protein